MFLRDLQALVGIKSIKEISFPDTLDDPLISQERKNLILSDIEWTSNRIHLKLWISKLNRPWKLKSTIALTNRGAPPNYPIDLMPYFTQDLALALGSSGRIGASIENAGYGLLAENDYISITGSYVEDIVAFPPVEDQIEECLSQAWELGTESQIILQSSRRRYFVLCNNSNADIYITFGKKAKLETGIHLDPGSKYEYNNSIKRYDGVIAAVAAQPNSLLTGMIC